jgi:hypothetical protein
MMQTTKCDVLVVGAGPAGIAAAVAAVRAGADVIVVERCGAPGGSPSVAMVGTICGAYRRDGRSLCEGFLQEVSEYITDYSGVHPVEMTDGLLVIPCDPIDFQHTALHFLCAQKGPRLMVQSTVVSAVVVEESIHSVDVLAWNRMIRIFPRSVIDCSGEATVFYLASAATLPEEPPQAAALVALLELEKSDFASPFSRNLAVIRQIAKAAEKELSDLTQWISFVPTKDPRRLHVKLNLPYSNSPTATPVADLEIRGRLAVEKLSGFLKNALGGTRLIAVAPQVGIRSGRRGQGKYVLTDDDVLNCKRFEDGVACGCWPQEQWSAAHRPKLTHLSGNSGYYEIPARSLMAERIKNLFLAGRCLSGTEGALASARVIATCITTGYAAGKLGARCAQNIALEETIRELQKEQVRTNAD